MQAGLDGGASSAADKDTSSENGNGKDENRRPPYTINAVLHFLQNELNRFEIERAQWEMEKAELSARINFLNGERKGQEELKRDLIRRIKMLEYSLKQERAKSARLKSESKVEQQAEEDEETAKEEPYGPIEVDAVVPQPHTSPIYKQARSLLRQYLNEIGYSEKILDVRSFRVKNLLGIMPGNDTMFHDGEPQRTAEQALAESEQAIIDAAGIIMNNRAGEDNDSDSDGSGAGNLDIEAVTALDEFAFLRNEKSSAVGNGDPSGLAAEEWNVDESALNALKDNYRREKIGKEAPETSPKNEAYNKWIEEKRPKETKDVDMIDINDDINIKDVAESSSEAPSIQWRINFTLRSHMDSVRAMQFHPFEPVLITASEDGTAKMWNLADKDVKAQQPNSVIGVSDLEPRYTFRGHKGAIFSMDMNSTGDMFFTGGFDGAVCVWEMPAFDIPVYDHYDRRLLSERLQGHSQPVWSVVHHHSSNRLISASADGTIRLWELGLTKSDQYAEPQLRLYAPPQENARPRSIDLVSTETQQLLTAYTGKQASILDLETGQRALDFNLSLPEEEVGEINKIISHPTMPVTIMAGTDRRIRYFDNNSGQMIRSAVAHVESISTLAADPNGLYMLSGCDDGSLRVWDMETRVCIQEIAAHRKKHDMSVLAVAFHPSRPLIGSAGADSLVKVFSSQARQLQSP